MKSLYCALGLFFILPIASLEALAQKSAPSAPWPVVLPMQSANQHLYVELEDSTLGKLTMMIDTGSEKTLLTARAAAKAPMDRHLADRFYTFYGFGKGQKAKLKGHTTLHLRAQEHDLGPLRSLVLAQDDLSLGMKPEIQGVLGWEFFQHLCVRLDSKAQQMELSDPDRCQPQEEGFHAPPVEWLKEGLLLPVTVALEGRPALQLRLHVDTGSNSILLCPRLRSALGLEAHPQTETANQGKGVNGSYAFDTVIARSIAAEGGHPKVEGKIPIIVPRPGSYSQPSRLFSGKDEAMLAHDGVVGNSVLGLYVLVFDGQQKKLYERAYSFVPETKQ
jgi:predicted aspartyl protease